MTDTPLEQVSQVTSTKLSLQLFTPGPLIQAGIAASVSVMVLVASASIFTIVVTRSQFTAPPVLPDSYQTFKNTEKVFNVLDNDRDTERNAVLNIVAIDKPLYGTATISDDKQTVIYKSPYYYSGSFHFNYTAANEKLTASTTIYVTVLNNPPFGVDQIINVIKNSVDNVASVFGEPTGKGGKCFDTDDDKMYVSKLLTLPTNGQASISADKQSILYTPNKDSLAVDTVEFEFSDYNATAKAKLTFVVTNNRPTANPDLYTKRQATVNSLDLLTNDVDLNKDDLTIIKATSTRNARVIISDDKKNS